MPVWCEPEIHIVGAVASERTLAETPLRDELGIDSLATEEIEERYGVTIPEQLQDVLAAFGDAVDCIQSMLRVNARAV